jgi:hypothetical protein
MTMKVNKAGADWLLVRAWVDGEIASARGRLEGQQSENSTNYERGQIAVLRRLLREVEPEAMAEIEDPNYV